MQIFLPSRYEFYDIKHSMVKPMTGFHQSKFFRAAHEKSDLHMVNAINTLLEGGLTAGELTIPDFYFVMYWLRLNSYTRTQMVHRGVCNNPAHLQDVYEKKKEKESLVTVSQVPRTILETTELNDDYLKGFEEELTLLMNSLGPVGLTLTAPRMRDTIELHDTLIPENPDQSEEIAFLGDRAACVMAENGEPLSLKQRIELIQSMSIDVHDILDEWRLRVSMYGVKEVIKFKCNGCGAEVENPILISAHSFL